MKNNKSIRSILALSLGCAFAASFAPTAEAQTQQFTFSKNRPRLVVLLHGVTPYPHEDPEIGVGSSRHARYYWGFDFIKGAQGRPNETQMRVITPRTNGALRFTTNAREDWIPSKVPVNTYDLAPICYPVSWFTNLPTGIETNQTLIKDYIKLMTKNGADSTMVMVSTRNGGKHFMPQLGEAVDEIYDSYMAAFSHLEPQFQPQIYLVGHSFGGVIARGILANPSGADLFGNKLNVVQRTKANFLRDRTVLVKTLSAPHEGTHIPHVAGDVSDYISKYGYTALVAYYGVVAALPWKGYSAAWVRGKARTGFQDALNAVSGKRDCLKDLTRMNEYNTGILRPFTARRSDNTYVPIYTASGRNPGGKYYDASRSVFGLGGHGWDPGTWNPLSNLDYAMGYSRFAKEAMALTLIESLMRVKGYGRESQRPWGTATLAEGDRVTSPMALRGYSKRDPKAPLGFTSLDIKWIAADFFDGKPYVWNKADSEWDNDGFLGFDSGHALNLTGHHWFRVYNQALYGTEMPWDRDNHGSLMFNPGNGLWLHNELVREAGPYIYTTGKRRSVWNASDAPVTPKKGIKLELLQLHDLDNNLDYLTKADFSVRVRIGKVDQWYKCPDNTRTVTTIPAFTVNNLPTTVVPIKINVIERDQPYDPDDTCVLSPDWGKTSLYLYFDTRTGRITGDMNGAAGDTLLARPWTSTVANRVSLRFRITQTQ